MTEKYQVTDLSASLASENSPGTVALRDSIYRCNKFSRICIQYLYISKISFFRAVKFSAKLMGKALARRVKCTILYATETGKSERFARSLCEIFKHAFDAKVMYKSAFKYI